MRNTGAAGTDAAAGTTGRQRLIIDDITGKWFEAQRSLFDDRFERHAARTHRRLEITAHLTCMDQEVIWL